MSAITDVDWPSRVNRNKPHPFLADTVVGSGYKYTNKEAIPSDILYEGMQVLEIVSGTPKRLIEWEYLNAQWDNITHNRSKHVVSLTGVNGNVSIDGNEKDIRLTLTGNITALVITNGKNGDELLLSITADQDGRSLQLAPVHSSSTTYNKVDRVQHNVGGDSRTVAVWQPKTDGTTGVFDPDKWVITMYVADYVAPFLHPQKSKVTYYIAKCIEASHKIWYLEPKYGRLL